ncbi:MAG: hypothetical protein J3Q66DRAFT_437970 [Benniella sp.]|nr:MAG: hypothetical protein J3Q66DRAFT_437970 [Benniella sp.]
MDEQRLLLTGLMMDTFGYVYQVEEDSWAPSLVVVPNPNRAEVHGVRDLETGLVYFAGGFETGNDSIMSVYNFTRDAMVSPTFIIPTGLMTDRSYYAGVYVKSRKSIFYFGGFSNSNDQINSGPGVLTEFVPSTGSWSKLTTTNAGPSHRSNLCMAASENGTTIMIFGGLLDSKAVAGDTWVLDIPTLTWKRGPDSNVRRSMNACTIVNNTFISWGGYDGVQTADSSAILFDIPSMTFITEYSPPVTESSSTSKRNIIIGSCSAAAILLIIAITALVYVLRKRKGLREAKEPAATVSDGENKSNGYIDFSLLPTRHEKEGPHPIALSKPISKADIYFEQLRKGQRWSPTQPSSLRESQTGLPSQRQSQPAPARLSQGQDQRDIDRERERNLMVEMIREQQQLIQLQQRVLDGHLLGRPQQHTVGQSGYTSAPPSPGAAAHQPLQQSPQQSPSHHVHSALFRRTEFRQNHPQGLPSDLSTTSCSRSSSHSSADPVLQRSPLRPIHPS